MIDRRKALTVTVVLVLLCSTLSFYAGATNLVPRLTATISGKVPVQQVGSAQGLDYKRIEQVRKEIDQNFLTPPATDKLTEGALKGMVEATGDRYSAYFTPKEYAQFLDQLKSTMSGIGVYVELSAKTGLVTVVSPMKGTPGEQAGLRAGDAIIAVDGKDVHGLTLEDAVDMIRGPKGTQVKLKVMREGTDNPLEFLVTRATIELPSVEAKMVDPAHGVGYIQILQFKENVSQRVSKSMSDLKAQGMTRLILDLRQDPGGLLEEAINVSSIFVPKGTPVVFVDGREGKQTYNSKGATDAFDMPLLVLVDNGSASASEIVAGALKDLKIGTLMGVKTFGKGSVQTFHTLPDGSGIKLTTAHYLTAGGISIHEKGIDPDIVKENPKKVVPGDPGDVQLQEAIKYIQTMKR
ncbi:MAG TPA: S41 family peptidase [Symbiobacteriaceae bacterium]